MLQNSDTSSRCTTSILNLFAFLNRSKVTYTNTNILHSTVKWFYFLIHVFYTEPVEVANENEKKKKTKNPKRSARPVWTVFLLHRKIIRIKQQRNANR